MSKEISFRVFFTYLDIIPFLKGIIDEEKASADKPNNTPSSPTK